MQLKQLIAPLVNICIFSIAGIALYELANRHAWNWSVGQPAPPTENIQTEVPVEIGAIVRTTLRRSLAAYGHVDPAPASTTQPDAQVRVAVANPALVAEVDCIEGQHIEKGQLLFQLDHRTADAAVRIAQQYLDDSQSNYNLLTSTTRPASTPDWLIFAARWQLNLAQAQLQRVQAAQALLTYASPISGIVAKLNIRPGEVADPKIPAIELIDPARIVLALDIPGFYCRDLKIGQSVLIQIPQFQNSSEPAKSISAQISFIDPTIDPSTGMASVDVALPSNAGFKPGEFFGAQVIFDEQSDCLAVPADAVVPDSLGRARIALVSDDQRQATMKLVQTGIRDGDLIQLLDNDLQAGQMIVTGGAYGLAGRTGIRVLSK